MTWQKAVFFGGAILLLTACSNATAPTEPAQLQVSKSGVASLGDSTGTTTTQSGYYVRSGAIGFGGTIYRAP
ncbi:MAG TPA: hypothetical protein VKH19_01695 [Gemmatimonadaceae bacterium]|nr:hypothetical protein [Gemmatimonadaceae bacterium]